MKNIAIIFIFFMISLSLNAQDKRVYEGTLSYILHSAVKGETIYSLTRNYSVSQEVLLRYNPFLSKGLKVGQQLKIPVSQKQDSIGIKEKVSYYRASKNETLKKIAGYFSLDESDLLECNPNLLHGILPVNQIVRIPDRKRSKNSNLQEKNQPEDFNIISHKVTRKETLYGISQKYDCSVSDILKLNPEIKDRKRLRKGIILKIPVSVVPENDNKETEVVLPEIIKPDKDNLFEVN
ncbi:MAG: LysM peptidoglycan-binding domain-containing protein, partial [Prolixibacteraceae bacterium]|nr:LysM peptidoglycan-binding domain-containing protein [Prolixibacteraceae bacterium]